MSRCRYDNESGKGDHRHIRGHEEPYRFVSAPARRTLLEAVKRSGPVSINALARLLGRNYKNVHTDVMRLVELGLIERGCDQRISVTWDTIRARMKLAA